MRGQFDQFEQFRDALAGRVARDMVQFGVQAQELFCSQPVVEAEMFGQEADAGAHRRIAQRDAEEKPIPAAGGGQVEQHFDRGGLAGAVGTEKAENFAVLHPQGQVLDGDFLAEDFT